MNDLTDITFIKRITIGNTNPSNPKDDTEIEKQIQLLNRCLSEHPKGIIIGQEKDFQVIRIGEHQVIQQSTTYHIGFKRKPTWLTD
ncbi:hypothetical protein GCM10008967_07380 [Bacillus carboniphilus]|uniref:Uncharacterized protein n=1 Tax=Bacillus carboniphilus TaxID=86663 RepID=A0ABN0VWZ2_9BACI